MLCSYHLSGSKTFSSPPKETSIMKQSFAILPSPYSLETTNLFLVSLDLPVLDVSYKRTHTIVTFFVWFLPISVMLLRFVCGCHVSVLLFLFMAEKYSIACIYHSAYPFIHWRTFGLCHLLAIVISAAMNMCIQVPVFKSLGNISRSGIAALYANYMFSILRSCQTVFQSNCTILHSHQQRLMVPVSPHSHQCLLFFISVL